MGINGADPGDRAMPGRTGTDHEDRISFEDKTILSENLEGQFT